MAHSTQKWEGIQLDFADPTESINYLIAVDYSAEWPGIHPICETISDATAF